MARPFPIRPLVLLLLIPLLFAAGCAGRGTPSKDISSKYHQDDEELVDQNYIPRDDGQPLTASELKAFRSLGELDRNLSQEETAIVETHFKYFVHERRDTLQRFVDRTARYLPYMKKTFTDRGIPDEIVYLSMVESGGNPNAVSRAGATGLWQFMPYTGKKYGLEQDRWIDERRDPYKATYAASDYLLKLYGDFNNWHLAIAAYNAGEGKIGKAVEGTGANDFFELCRLDCNLEARLQLKDETRNYVPRFLAMVKIMRNLKLLGFQTPSPDAAYNLTAVTVPAGTNLSGMAQNLGLTWDEFSGMNPAFRRTASPPTTSTTAYLPANMTAQAQTWLASNESRLYADWKEYTVRRGDTLGSIAKRHRTSIAALKDANNLAKLPAAGTRILIPGRATATEYAAYDNGAAATRGSSGKYTVRSGDTLFSLAQDWGTSVEAIRSTNRMSSDRLELGRRLIIPAGAKAAPREVRTAEAAPSGRASTERAVAFTGSHTIKSGETLSGIAQTYGVSVAELCSANSMTEKSPLRAGRAIKVPGKATAAAEPAKAPKTTASAKPAKGVTTVASADPVERSVRGTAKAWPTEKEAEKFAAGPDTDDKPAARQSASAGNVRVSAGDTLYSLARKNNTSVDALCRANNISPKTPLKVGNTLRLP